MGCDIHMTLERRIEGAGTYKTIPVPDFETRLIKRAIELFRDPMYQFHGVHEWKEAA